MTQPSMTAPALSVAERVELLGRAPEDWPDRACAGEDPNVFFAPDDEALARRFRYTKARRICQRCPLKTLPCREWAVRTGQEHGMWGAWSPDELRAERYRRAAAAGKATADGEGNERGAA